MSSRWAFDRYAFGAARIVLRPEPYPGADRELGLWQGLALASRTGSRAGGALSTRTAIAGGLLLGAGLIAMLFSGALQSREPSRELEIVRFELPPPEELPPIPEPEPILEPEPVLAPIAARPPPRAPEPARVAKPAPARPPVAKPAPTPVRVARPELPPPPPRAAAPRIAAAPPRAPVTQPALAKPVISIDAVAAPRARPPASQPPPLALRLAAARPASPRPAPSFDLRAPAAPSLLAQDATPAREPGRTAAAAPARASARRSLRPPAALALPALAAGGPVRDPGAEPTPARAPARAGTPAGSASHARTIEPRLSGVPLGSLASCISDRKEDSLKQQLVAIVGQPSECVSEAGRYRFVEMRNLNAFLLWVERAPTRREADRCVELSFALECVRKRAGGEWSRG